MTSPRPTRVSLSDFANALRAALGLEKLPGTHEKQTKQQLKDPQ